MDGEKNVISFMNMKGGVGKTTICVNIAGTLATMGKKVLIIDIDPQMNASQYLLPPNILEQQLNSAKTVYGLYKKEIEQPIPSFSGQGQEIADEPVDDEKELIYTVRTNLYLLCGDLNMTRVTDKNGTLSDYLLFFIQNNNLQKEYEFIFIDCPPTDSFYTTSALKASNYYILVIKPDYLSTIGLDLFNNTIKSYNSRRTNENRIHQMGIIINMFQRGNEYHIQKIEHVKNTNKFTKVFQTNLYNQVNIAKNSEVQKLMYETIGCKQTIRNLTKEFLRTYSEKVGL